MTELFAFTSNAGAISSLVVLFALLYTASSLYVSRTRTQKRNETIDSPRSCATLSPNGTSPKQSSTPTKECLPVPLSSLPFQAKARSDACIVIQEGRVIVHGGASDALLGDIQIFDCDHLKWNAFDITPNDRDRFSMISTANGIVVFGGMSKQGKICNDLNTIELTTNALAWSEHQPSNQSSWPSPRYDQAMCVIDDASVALFGGLNESGIRLNDLWILETEALTQKSTGSKWKHIKEASSQRPKPRSKPSIAHVNDKIYLLGETNKSRGEVDSFNLVTQKWVREVTCGQEPARQDCKVHSLHKTMKLITVSNSEPSSCGMFNRLDILDVQSQPMTWTQVDLSWHGDWTMIPGVRRSFCSTVDPNKGILYVFGGKKSSLQPAEGEEDSEDLLGTLIVANFSRHI
jgi:hypothetical protein